LMIDPSYYDLMDIKRAKYAGEYLLKEINRSLFDEMYGQSLDIALKAAEDKLNSLNPITEELRTQASDLAFNKVSSNILKKIYWQKDLIQAAGRITAARSFKQNPDWADLERVHLEEIKVRYAYSIMMNMGDDLKFPPTQDQITMIQASVENEISRERLEVSMIPSNVLGMRVIDKIEQYVWTGNLDLCLARASIYMRGRDQTLYGDVIKVEDGVNQAMHIFDEVERELKTTEKERQSQQSILSWFCGSGELLVTPEDVTNEMFEKVGRKLRLTN
jgi:hypothetical protein